MDALVKMSGVIHEFSQANLFILSFTEVFALTRNSHGPYIDEPSSYRINHQLQ